MELLLKSSKKTITFFQLVFPKAPAKSTHILIEELTYIFTEQQHIYQAKNCIQSNGKTALYMIFWLIYGIQRLNKLINIKYKCVVCELEFCVQFKRSYILYICCFFQKQFMHRTLYPCEPVARCSLNRR